MLESIAIYYSQDSERRVDLEQFGMLRGPRLSSFSASGVDLSDHERLPLPWHQLMVLVIDGPCDTPWDTPITTEKALQIISRCPKLRRCKLVTNDEDQWLSHPSVELKFLHTLELECAFTSIALLKHLHLPELRTLSLHRQTDQPNAPSVADFFTRSPRLESLVIDSNLFSKSALLSVLRNLPPTMQRIGIRHNPLGLGSNRLCGIIWYQKMVITA